MTVLDHFLRDGFFEDVVFPAGFFDVVALEADVFEALPFAVLAALSEDPLTVDPLAAELLLFFAVAWAGAAVAFVPAALGLAVFFAAVLAAGFAVLVDCFSFSGAAFSVVFFTGLRRGGDWSSISRSDTLFRLISASTSSSNRSR